MGGGGGVVVVSGGHQQIVLMEQHKTVPFKSELVGRTITAERE